MQSNFTMFGHLTDEWETKIKMTEKQRKQEENSKLIACVIQEFNRTTQLGIEHGRPRSTIIITPTQVMYFSGDTLDSVDPIRSYGDQVEKEIKKYVEQIKAGEFCGFFTVQHTLDYSGRKKI